LWTRKAKQAKRILREENYELFVKVSALTGKNLSEKAWKYIHAIIDAPTCECGAPLDFLDFNQGGYRTFCSTKCMANSDATNRKKKATSFNKHGVTHFSKTPQYRKKVTETLKTRYGNNVTNPGQIPQLKDLRSRAKQKTFYAELMKKIKGISDPLFSFEEYTSVRDGELPWRCVICGEMFKSHLVGKLPRCPKCFPPGNFGQQSSVEKEIIEEIRKWYSGEIIENSRKIIEPKELDLFFPEKNVAIEVNGIYWHSDHHLPDRYHSEKYQMCCRKGIKLLMITDYEWTHRRKTVINMIKYRLGVLKHCRIHARKCVISEISSKDAREFLENNHIGGAARASIYYGLRHKSTLVAVLSIQRHRFGNQDKLEIVRFATSGAVVGAFTKLLSHISTQHRGETLGTYADLRYGAGEVYSKAGFVLKMTTTPGYWYLFSGKLYHRLSWTKKKLVRLGHDPHLTESQIMKNLGATRFFDCGHNYYEKEL